MEKRFYKIIKGGLLISVWVFDGKKMVEYNMANLEKEEFSYIVGVHCDLLCICNMKKIDQKEFEYLQSIWVSLGMLKWKRNIQSYPVLEIEEMGFGRTTFSELSDEPEVVKEFEPITKYQLYNVSGSIAIHGNSEKSMEELVDFFETHGRNHGFRILDAKGRTRGYVHADLFNSLSYHVKPI